MSNNLLCLQADEEQLLSTKTQFPCFLFCYVAQKHKTLIIKEVLCSAVCTTIYV